mmetsp:Transcript_1788/g.4938  ORF Transcript_1788/g.4938 Transcript_1788/m.4938 type:complete len:255 (+) Transcript_1788:618-1382(+)
MARSVCRGRNRSGAARPGVLHLACHLLGGGFEDRNHRERGGAHAAAPAGACARGARADADASLRKGRKQRLALAAAAVTPNYASCCGGGESDNGGRNQRDLCGVAGGEAAALRRLVVARPRRRQARRVCDVVAHEVEERVLGPRGRVVPAAAPHALDHLMRYNLDRREMQSKEGSRRISANECIAPRNRPHKTGSPRSLCRPTSAAVRAVVARAGSRSPGCDCARRRVPPAPGVARVDCHAVARVGGGGRDRRV